MTLIERLKYRAQEGDGDFLAAIDALEAARAEIERLRQEYDQLQNKTSDQYDEQQAEIERLRDLCRELDDWFKAYPVDIFTPLQGDPIKKTGDYDTAEKCNLITRASASMARHMIERIPEKIRKALAATGEDND